MDSIEQTRRLAAVRAELARRDLDLFLVPRADEFQNEYVAPASERLAWISGFDGSAGLAAIGRERAAIFVDGRYTIQVRRQALAEAFEHRHLTEEPLESWTRATLKPGARIGYDPRLHTPGAIRQLETALAGQDLVLVAVETNPLDAAWADRPAPPKGKVFLYPVEYAGRTSAEKRAAIGETLRGEGLGALVVTAPDNLAWVFNIRGDDVPMLPVAFGYGILMADGSARLFLDPDKLGASERAAILAEGGVEILPEEAFPPALATLPGCRVRVDRATASIAVVDALKAGGATPAVGPDPISLAKACKSEAELSGMRAAHRRDALAMVRFQRWFDETAPGDLDEWVVSEKLEAFRSAGEHYRGLSFSTISASGESAALAHYRADETDARKLQSDQIFLLDSGAQYLDGTTDITRVTVTGTPSEEMRRRYTQVLKGHLAISRARFPAGVTGAQLDPLARQFLWASGTDFDHGTGHGVGCYLSVHEGPQSLSKRGTETPLKPGMVVSNEPGYYKPGAFGIRIENLLVVTELDPQPDGAERVTLGFETLTLVPYERRLIDLALLTTEERDAVDAYHARVRAALEPHLAPADAAYLKAQTAPLES